jgi:hypothetical protein
MALLPSALMICGWVLGLAAAPRILRPGLAPSDGTLAVLAIAVGITLAGYVGVLFTLPVEDLPGRPQSLGTDQGHHVVQVLRGWPSGPLPRAPAGLELSLPLLVLALILVFLHNART